MERKNVHIDISTTQKGCLSQNDDKFSFTSCLSTEESPFPSQTQPIHLGLSGTGFITIFAISSY